MADLKKFEEMLERLVNEDKEGAEELFHEIVVEKSREIYENLLEDDLEDEEVDEATDEEVDESDDEEVDESDDDELDEGFDLDEFEVEADPMDMGGDPADDMMGDVEPEGDMDMDMGDEEGEEGEGDVEDRIEDLEDALDDLKAEFDKMMAGEEGEDHDMDDMGDMGDDGEEEEDDTEEEAFAFESDDEEVDEASDEEVEEKATNKSQAEQMREYVEKVVGGHGAETKGKAETADNKKSTVAGKNDMGGTASNLNQGDTGDVVEAGKGALKGNGVSDTSPKDMNTGNVNTPGSKTATKTSAVAKGHGAEKKGQGETADNKKSTIGS